MELFGISKGSIVGIIFRQGRPEIINPELNGVEGNAGNVRDILWKVARRSRTSELHISFHNKI